MASIANTIRNLPTVGRITALAALLAISTVAVAVACRSADPTPTAVPPAPTATQAPAVPTSTPAPTVTPAPTRAPDPTVPSVKIGTLLDATGDLAVYGPPIQKAVDLAVKLVNDAGGVNGAELEVIHRDSGTSEQIATDAASALVNVDGVGGVVGSLSSGVTLAVAQSQTVPSGVVMISPASTSPALTTLNDNDFLYRTTVSDALQGVVLAQLAHQLEFDNVATLYINNPYGEGLTRNFADKMQELGRNVSQQVAIEGGQASYLAELRRAASDGAQVLLAIAYPETAGVFLREASESGLFSQFLFVDGTKSQDMFNQLGLDVFNGSFGTAPGAPAGNPNTRTFQDLYSSGTDGDPSSLFIAEGFDAAVLLALAIEKADAADGASIKAAIRDVANPPGTKVGPGDIARALQLVRDGQDVDYVGAAGSQDFDTQGDVLNTIEVWRVVDGEITSTGQFVNPGETISLPADAGTSGAMASADSPVRIGTLLDATGDLAVFGPPIQRAVDLAVELVNEAGGVNGSELQVVHRDSGTSEQIATDAASALVNVDGVGGIVGSLSSGVTLAVAQSQTIPGGVVMISPASTSPALTTLNDNDFLYRTTVSDALQGVVLAQLAHQLEYDNVATLYINNPYGEGLTRNFANQMQELGRNVSQQVAIEGGQASYLSELRRAASSGAEVLLAIAYPETAGVFLREASESGLFSQFLFVDGTKNQDMFDQLGLDVFNGSYGTAPGAPAGNPNTQTFRDLYDARTDQDPSALFISEGFDAAVLLALAIEKADAADGASIKAALRDVANPPGTQVGPGDIARALQLIRDGQDIDYVGAAGSQDFDANGDVLNTIEVWRIDSAGSITSTGQFVNPGETIDIQADGDGDKMTASDPARIGTLLDATGDLATYGPPIQTAVDLAVQLVNAAGGVNGAPLQVVHRDSGTSEQIATDAASALVNVDGIGGIVGSLSSGVTLAVARSQTIPGQAVMISPASTSPAISVLDDNDFLFRTTVSDALQGVVAAQLAHQLEYDNVATLYINNPYGEGLTRNFADAMKDLGRTVSEQVAIEGGQASYLSELRRAAGSGATVLMAIAYPETAGVFLREAIESGLFEQFLFVDGTKSQDMFDNFDATAFEGAYGTAPGAPSANPNTLTFKNLYASMTDGNPESPFISEGFDAAVLLALAIELADSADGPAIKAALRQVANPPGTKVGPGDIARALELIRSGQDIDYEGAAGSQDFDEQGDVLNTIEIWQVVGGSITSTNQFVRPGQTIELGQ